MSHWQFIGAWISINIALGIFGPLIVGILFMAYAPNPPKLTLREFYAQGELAFASLLIGLTVIVDILKSPFSIHTTAVIIVGLLCLSFMGAHTWAVPLCRKLGKLKVSWNRVWQDSWMIALAIFTIGTLTEISLEFASKG